jgi:hypothetical protein
MLLNMTDWDLVLDEDAVLRGQGADPAIIRERSPRLVQTAARALETGRSLLRPQVTLSHHEVKAVRHERITLTSGGFLSGAMIAQHLGPAQKIIILVCTIGTALDDLISEVTDQDMVYALALDGVGSAAVEALANEACRLLEVEAAQEGFQASIPLSPGMIGWSVDQGQPQIFTLIDGEEIGVTLNDYYIMTPRKSLSMVIGLGPDMGYKGKVCDFCAMRDTCRYQDHYDPTEV